jgi:hypothetical protein
MVFTRCGVCGPLFQGGAAGPEAGPAAHHPRRARGARLHGRLRRGFSVIVPGYSRLYGESLSRTRITVTMTAYPRVYTGLPLRLPALLRVPARGRRRGARAGGVGRGAAVGRAHASRRPQCPVSEMHMWRGCEVRQFTPSCGSFTPRATVYPSCESLPPRAAGAAPLARPRDDGRGRRRLVVRTEAAPAILRRHALRSPTMRLDLSGSKKIRSLGIFSKSIWYGTR